MTKTFSLFKHLVFAFTPLVSLVIAGPAHAQKPATTPIPFAKSSADKERTGDALPATVQTNEIAAAKPADASKASLRTVNKKDLSQLKTLNEKYRKAKSITMNVAKDVKLGLVGSERKSNGTMALAKGQLHMELAGAEHTLLVVNKKNVFAVTYPDKALKGAAIQVIKGDVAKKQKKPNALTSLLGPGGFLKSFKPTGVQTIGSEQTYFLAPIGESDMTRAQLKVSNNEIHELHYWDARDNETTFSFSNIVFGAKVDASLFNYTPPADADVMNL